MLKIQACRPSEDKPLNNFVAENGSSTKLNPLRGEVRYTFKHNPETETTRMNFVVNKLDQNVDEGIFYSPTFGVEEKITASLMEKPPDIPKPTSLSIRKVTPERPANVDAGWKLKGDVK